MTVVRLIKGNGKEKGERKKEEEVWKERRINRVVKE